MTAKDEHAEETQTNEPAATAELSEQDLAQVAGGATFNPKEFKLNGLKTEWITSVKADSGD